MKRFAHITIFTVSVVILLVTATVGLLIMLSPTLSIDHYILGVNDDMMIFLFILGFLAFIFTAVAQLGYER